MEILGVCIVAAASLISLSGINITLNINRTFKDNTEKVAPKYVNVSEIEEELSQQEVVVDRVAEALRPGNSIVNEINKFIGGLADGE